MSSQAPADGTLRQPCPHCAEPIALDARLCHHCHSDVLVDVRLRAPLTDGRQRYQVARGLADLPNSPPLSAIQAALASATPAAALGVTRAFAREAIAFLESRSVKAFLDIPRGADDVPRRSRAPLVGALAVAILAAGGYVGWRQISQDEAGLPGAASTTASAPATTAPEGPALSAREIAQRSLPATVAIRCRNSVGSGFFVGPDLVMTNAHVLCKAHDPIQVVLSDDRKLTGIAEQSNELVDVGLVRVPGAHETPLPLGDVASLAPGDKVTIIGSPMGLGFTVHEGSVSSLQRTTRGVAYIQLDAKINPGNSGGPVVDRQGRVVGIVTLKLQAAEGIGLAVPINYAYSHLGYAAAPSAEAARSAAFTKMLERAKTEQAASGTHEEIVPADAGLDDQPLLAAAYMDEYQRLVVRLVRAMTTKPRYEEIALRAWRGVDHFCTLKGDVSNWKELDTTNAPGLMSPELLQALGERHLFMGDSPLRWDLCNRDKMSSGVEIELVGGHPQWNRLALTAGPPRTPSYGGSYSPGRRGVRTR